MKTITQQDVDRAAAADPYWTGRWEYLGPVCEQLAGVPDCRVLEVGPWTLPLVPGSTVMDVRDRGCPGTVVHDATARPWPFQDGAFDLVVSLQVWEHLNGGQARATAEAARVAGYGIFSIPWKWDRGEPGHVGLDGSTIRTWFGGAMILTSQLVGNPGRERIILGLDLKERKGA